MESTKKRNKKSPRMKRREKKQMKESVYPTTVGLHVYTTDTPKEITSTVDNKKTKKIGDRNQYRRLLNYFSLKNTSAIFVVILSANELRSPAIKF